MLSKVLQTTETERNMIMQNDNDFVVAPSVPVAVGVVFYVVTAVLFKAITREDCLLLPKGEKIAKILHL